jgi:hypothetical protein
MPRGRDAGGHVGADDPPSILPIKSLDTGVINVSRSAAECCNAC